MGRGKEGSYPTLLWHVVSVIAAGFTVSSPRPSRTGRALTELNAARARRANVNCIVANQMRAKELK